MPRRRHAAPAPEGTVARLLEDILCNNGDCFPRIMCIFPLCIGLIFGFVFTLSTTLTAAPGVLPAFSAAGFVTAAAATAYLVMGAPVCRQRGCVGSCSALGASAVALCCSHRAVVASGAEVKESPLVSA